MDLLYQDTILIQAFCVAEAAKSSDFESEDLTILSGKARRRSAVAVLSRPGKKAMLPRIVRHAKSTKKGYI